MAIVSYLYPSHREQILRFLPAQLRRGGKAGRTEIGRAHV